MKKVRAFGLLCAAVVALGFGQANATGLIAPFEWYKLPVGAGPGAIARSATGMVFVANTGSGTVSVINEVTGRVLRTVAVGPAPQGIAIDDTQGRVYVAVGQSNKVAVLNSATGAPLGSPITVPQCTGPTGPWGIAVNSTTHMLYVACYSANTLVAVQGTTGAIVRAVVTGGGPLGLVADPATNLVYLGMFGQGRISVYDGAALALVSNVTGGVSPGLWGLTLDPVTHRVFAANYAAGTIQTILGTRVTVTDGGFSGPEWISFDPVHQLVWIPENTSNRVTGLDVLTGDVYPVGVGGTSPTATAVNPAGIVYSANYGTSNVSAILAV